MSNYKQQEIDEWMENVEDICGKVKDILDGKLTEEELNKGLDENDRRKLEKLRVKEEKAKREEAERQAKIARGREGGGDKENYENYCKRCKVEFTLPTANCVRCGKETMTCKERRAELMEMLEKYKETKSRKEERKKKWEMWKKTQQIFWKKGTTDYEKWQYYTDSEDEAADIEKNLPPVLPENDPSFRALKTDLEERNRNRRQRAVEAHQLKIKGNDMLKKKYYDAAIKAYSEGIELYRSNRYLWSNRALAHLKKEDYASAIDDCTKMLEYAEVMEDGYTKSKDVNFKFFARRSMAYRGLKKFDKAIDDISEALKLIPDDQSAIDTKKELESLKEANQKLEEAEKKFSEEELVKNFSEEQLQVKAEADSFISKSSKLSEASLFKEIQDYDYFKLKDLVTDKNLKLYFFKKQGPAAFKKILKKEAFRVTSGEGKLNFLNFVRAIAEEDVLYIDELIDNLFYRTVIKKIMKDLEELYPNNAEKKEMEQVQLTEENKEAGENVESASKPAVDQPAEIYNYKILELEEYMELLIGSTESRSVRAHLREKAHLLLPIFSIIQESLAPAFDKEHNILSSSLNLFSNLCMSDPSIKNTEIKDTIVKNHLPFLFTFSAKVLAKPAKKFITLKNSCLAFLVNLATDKAFRDYVVNKIVTFEGLHKNNRSIKVQPDDYNHVAFFMQNMGDAFTTFYTRTSEGSLKDQQTLVMKFYEHSTGLLLNLFFQLTDRSTVEHLKSHFRRWQLDVVCVNILHNCLKFKLNMGILLNRFVNVVAKLGFESNEENNAKMLFVVCQIANLFDENTENNRDFFTDAVRFIASFLQSHKELGKTAVTLTLSSAKGFISQIKSILINESKNTMRFVNTCCLLNEMIPLNPALCSTFREVIPSLITVVTGTSGVVRRNASICIAKLCNDKSNLEYAKSIFGPDLLFELNKFVNQP